MRVSWWLCNKSEIHLCWWKVLSLVVCSSQSSLSVTKANKEDKNRQNTLFLFKENMNLVPNKQLLVNAPFQSTIYRKKKLCVDNKVQETVGDVYCPTCRNEKCVYILSKRATSFCDYKKCKACCHVLNIHFKDQKPTISFFGGDSTHRFSTNTSRDYEKEKPSHFLRNFSGNHNQAHPNPNQKKVEVIPFMA